MHAFFIASFFILGTVMGSFYNVCILRIPLGQDIFISRSRCPKCHTKLQPRDLVPVFSYLLLKGRCRYCSASITRRYPMIELLTGALFAATYLLSGLNPVLVPNLILISLLIIITFIDLDHMIIPHSLTITGMLTALAWQLTSNHLTWPSLLLGLALGFGLPALLVALGGMGGGDAMLGGMFGLFFGLKYTFVLLMLSFILGGVYSLYVLLTKQKSRKDKLPFGPFLALAGLIMLFFGQQLLLWYGL